MVPRARLQRECWVPVLLWLGVIYFFSTDTFRSSATQGIIAPLLMSIFGLTASEAAVWHGAIRKAGHVSEYALLAVLVCRAIECEFSSRPRSLMLSWVFIVFVAALDEFHQGLTQFRSGSPVDVAYDAFGGMLGLIVAMKVFTFVELRLLRPHSVL